MTSSELLALIAGAWLLSAFYWCAVCGFVATEKGRAETKWALAGFFGQVLAFIPLIAAPRKQ